MMRVGIIGCGKIADQHAVQIHKIPKTQIVGVCDREELMAKQMHERFGITYYCSDVRELLRETHPDVVHITTPPQSHFELAKVCLESGCHIYVEKPFTVNTAEAGELLRIAIERKLKITVGHNAQFTDAAIRMRELVAQGFLGGAPVHIESYYGYDLGDQRYAKALLGDKEHWVRRLPGKLLQNNISHGISKIVEFLTSDSPRVIAFGFTSPFLRNIGEQDIVDELRVIIYDNESTTAYFTFSTQISPVLHQLRIYGPKNGIIVDDDHQTVIRLRGAKYKSYLDQFVPPYLFAKQYLANSCSNVKKFVKRELHGDKGMKCLIESFYHSIQQDLPLPIPYKEILLTSKIMDAIFEQINSK
jgi:predicted dehydrogenase